MAEIWNNSVLFYARHRVFWPQASSDRWRLRKYLARSCLADLGFVKIVHGKDYKLFVFSLRSALFAAKPATPMPFRQTYRCWPWKVLDQLQAPPCHWLRTIWKVEQRRHLQPRPDWESNGGSTRWLNRRLSGTRTGVCLAESCAKRPTASRWWMRRSLTWCMTSYTREVQFAGDNGVVDTSSSGRGWRKKKTPLLEWKILPILREVLTLQSSLRAMASVGAAMLCLRKQGQPSPGCVWEWWDEQGGDQFASQEMTYHAARQIPGSSKVVDLKICFLVQINWFVPEQTPIASRYYHEFKKCFLLLWITVSDK